MDRNDKRFLLAIIVGISALVLFYIISSYFIKNNMFTSIDNVTWDNILLKLADDYMTMLFIPTILLIINRKNLKELGLCLESKNEVFLLILVMLVFFILHNDFTIGGFYKFFFYLAVVSFGEEFLYRGFMYNRMISRKRDWNKSYE